MLKALTLDGGKISWTSLSNRTVRNQVVILKNFGNDYIVPFPMFTCKKLFVDNCNRNFVYLNICKDIFPQVDTLYLNSDPGEPEVLYRKFNKIFLTEKLYSHKEKWNLRSRNIHPMTSDLFEFWINQNEPEEII